MATNLTNPYHRMHLPLGKNTDFYWVDEKLKTRIFVLIDLIDSHQYGTKHDSTT